MASQPITDASLVAARQSINEHYAAENPHDITPEKIGAASEEHTHTIDHVNLQNKGTNTHEQIDTALTNSANHLNNTSNPHSTTAAQIGAMPLSISALISADFNTTILPGIYLMNHTQPNAPTASAYYWLEVFRNNGTSYIYQRATQMIDETVLQRTYNGATWSAWKQIYPAVLT